MITLATPSASSVSSYRSSQRGIRAALDWVKSMNLCDPEDAHFTIQLLGVYAKLILDVDPRALTPTTLPSVQRTIAVSKIRLGVWS